MKPFNIKLIVAIGSVVSILGWAMPATASLCSERSARITAAFVRRWARDTGNLLAVHGCAAALIDGMIAGVPVSTSAVGEMKQKARRLWGHTENKIHRKCTDAEAGETYPGGGATTLEIVDDLFNDYAIPWASAVRALAGSYGERCTQYAFIHAGYAARDFIRDGADNWARYQTLVERVCPPGLFEEVKDATSRYLFTDLGELR